MTASVKWLLIASFCALLYAGWGRAARCNEIPPDSSLPGIVAAADSLSPVSVSPPLGFDAHHVQGLAATEDWFFITGVDKYAAAAWIFKVNRKTGEKVLQKSIAKRPDIHPSGIDFDGKYIWVAMAVYEEYSHTYMTIVDPETLNRKVVFEVDDHIGAVARHGDLVIGANWNSRDFYFFTLNGELVDKKPSPTGIGYQDCEGVDGFLMCTGGGFLDWIDIGAWTLAKRFPVGVSEQGSPLSREGVSWYDGHVFFLPDDGAEGKIYEYSFTNPDGQAAEQAHP